MDRSLLATLRLSLPKIRPVVKSLKLFAPKKAIIQRSREFRGSRHERGYDSTWTKLAAKHRRRSPICIECERADIIVVCDVVDHKIPVSFRPELRLDPKNHWSLCHDCHNGIKRRLEAYAERTGQVDSLILWCDDPSTRPAALAMREKRPKQEMIV